MVQFNELRITPDGKNLIIDVSVQDMEYYDNVFIDSIIIDTEDTYIPSGPSTNPIFSYTVEESSDVAYTILRDGGCTPVLCDEGDDQCLISNSGNTKHLKLILNSTDFITIPNLNDKLFFVYVVTKGTPSSNTPCGLDNQNTLGVVFNKFTLYKTSMKFFKELESSCNISKGFIDFILRMKGLELSIKTGNYLQTIRYWNKFFKGKIENLSNTSNCGN